MKARNLWTLTAFGLVCTWIGARVYIGDILNDEYAVQQVVKEERGTATAPSVPPTEGAPTEPDEPEPRPTRGPVRFAPLADRFERVHRLAVLGAPARVVTDEGEPATQEALTADRETLIADAHAALDEASALELEWNARLADRTRRQLDALETVVGGLSPSEPGLQMHLLASRVSLMEAAGEPDEDRAKELAEAREYRPEDFSWEKR